jgi:predicted HD superfamily hydrolase involved in NAD metabolism
LHKILSDLLIDLPFEGEIGKDSSSLLTYYGCTDVAEHSVKVANEARKIALKFGADGNNAYIAGCLHDVSNIFPNDRRIDVCNELGIEAIKEECVVPSLLHPKISKVMALEIFGIEDKDILSAIECHSTLKANAGMIDMILFVADKMSWDNIHNGAFVEDIMRGLDISLEHGAYAYLEFMFSRGENVKVYHPWAIEAYNYMKNKLK